ncbi:MAG: MBL fold metallo-hydrolase [Alphaproteobacteria bacterium]|nr:MBL fold metallo-hydrolase [Alphaproteobacteria bacterium]
MPMSVPFVKEIEFEYGKVDQVSPMIRRVIAENPGPFTYKGTGTYIIGRGNVAIIDPGPLDDAHIEATLKAVEGETVTHILVTHTHRDHSPAAAPMKERTGAPTYGYGPHGGDRGGPKVEEGGDFAFVPDHVIKDGGVIQGDGWTFEAVHTPGHTSNHLCFWLKEENALFSGDHVMGWSTSIVSPPDGDMAQYMASLNKLLDRDDSVFWPTHGPPIRDTKPFVQSFIQHRQRREDQILECIADGQTIIGDMVPIIYVNARPQLYGAAARSMLAHLIQMQAEGKVLCDGEPGPDTVYSLPG